MTLHMVDLDLHETSDRCLSSVLNARFYYVPPPDGNKGRFTPGAHAAPVACDRSWRSIRSHVNFSSSCEPVTVHRSQLTLQGKALMCMWLSMAFLHSTRMIFHYGYPQSPSPDGSPVKTLGLHKRTRSLTVGFTQLMSFTHTRLFTLYLSHTAQSFLQGPVNSALRYALSSA